jgi:hypothetical protein
MTGAEEAARRQEEAESVREAERALIGAALLDPAVAAALDVEPDACIADEHRTILRAIYHVRETRGASAVDGMIVNARVASESVAGRGVPVALSYLAACQSVCPDSDNWRHYAEIVREAARARGVRYVTRQAALLAESDPEAAARYVAAALASGDAAEPVDVELPPGYHAGGDGSLWRDAVEPASPTAKGRPPARICPCIVEIIGRGQDVATGEHQLTLRWRLDGRTHKHTVARGQVATSRTITALADHGLPVTSSTASELVDYLAAAEEASPVRVVRTARATGWHGRAFLRGTHKHGADCPEWARGDGVDDIIDAVGERGDFGTWAAAVLPAVETHPVMRFLLAAAAAPPLLLPLGSPMWAVDLCGDAGGGKTSAARIAMSLWGDPAKYQQEWGATRVGIERVCAALCDLPVLLDDTRKAPTPAFPSQVVFDVVSGRGKLRGSIKGAQRTAKFRTVLVSTGEGPMTSGDAGSGGSRRRSLVVDQSPWGGRSRDLGADVRRITSTCDRHYGHAGRMLVDRLVSLTDDDRAAMVAHWHAMVDHYGTRIAALLTDQTAPIDAVSQYLATIHIAGEQLAEALGWPAMEWIDATLIARFASQLGQVDRARAAMRHALTWLGANPARVMHRESKSQAGDVHQPSAGYIGLAEEHRVAFVPTALDTELRRAGYDADAVVSAWHDRGWLLTEAGRKTRRVTYEGSTLPMYVVRSDIADAVLSGTDTDSPSMRE